MDKLRFIFQLDIFKTIWFNCFSRKVIRAPGCHLFVYPKTRIVLCKNSKIELTGKGYINLGLKSKFEPRKRTDLIILEGGIWSNCGKTDVLGGSYICINPHGKLVTDSVFLVESNIRCFSTISIGEGTMVGFCTKIMDSNMHDLSLGNTLKEKNSPVLIGKHSWVGANCLILKGVIIGDNSVVQAGLTVVADVSSGTVVSSNDKPRVLFSGNVKVTK